MSMLAPDCHHPALQTPGECWKPWPRLLWAASLLLLVACGRAPEAPSAPTSDTAIEAPSGFAVAAVNGEASDGRPALTVRFTRPLAQAQDLGQFLKVTDSEGKAVDGAWITDDGERIARFPHVKAQQEFTVEVLPGVVAADGSTLTEGLTRKVQSVDLPPADAQAIDGFMDLREPIFFVD